VDIGLFLEQLFKDYSSFIWGTPLLILLMGGGIFFSLYSRLVQFRYFRHAINVLRGKYDNPEDKGEINHYQALSTHLAATVGMGNISGVAVAIATGGPGAIFWMWISAFIGMATKFYTCTLAIEYRGLDSNGQLQGGPMYVIREGLKKHWHWLAVLFCVTGMIGVLPIFQANQLTQVFHDVLLVPNGLGDHVLDFTFFKLNTTDFITGLLLTALVASVIFGGIARIGEVAGKLVPFMVIIYFLSVLTIILINVTEVPQMISNIFVDAFTANAVLGGALGQIILIASKRAAFSNEAGIGTAPMAHGAAKTNQPIHEGLVAMLGPAIDTIVVCTLTALAILITGTWNNPDAEGVSITINAFNSSLPFGGYILTLCAATFAITSLFSLSYYGEKCYGFLFGAHRKHHYRFLYVFSIILGSVASLDAIINLIDGMYATMAIPTVISTLILAPKVNKLAKNYFSSLKNGEKS